MEKIRGWFQKIRESFWFLPSLVLLVMILLAHFVTYLDHALAPIIKEMGFDAIILEQESMRTFLATIAGSMMTVAGVVFSITILVLSQAAGQYTSRVLRNFMRNKNNQFVLGLFVGIFIFCLFLLANLHPTNNLIAAVSGFGLALLGVAFLISFIHTMSTSIQSSEIILNIKKETLEILEEIYPKPFEAESLEGFKPIEGNPVFSFKTGYVQKVDRESLVKLAEEKGVLIQLKIKTGEFIIENELLCSSSGNVDEEFTQQVNEAFEVGAYRTAEHDLTFGLQQLVDIALKGLSPGVNDLMTAQLAIDYLSSIYHKLATRKIIHEFLCDGGECKRLILDSWTFSSLLSMGFVPIIENAKDQPSVQKKMEIDLARIQVACKDEKRKKDVARLIEMVRSH